MACLYGITFLTVTAVIISVKIGSLEALHCSFCSDRLTWDNCEKAAVQADCSDALVNATHKVLTQYNPNLATDPAQKDFQCFRLQLELYVALNFVYIQGCTYRQFNFCEGWTQNGAKPLECAICSTGDASEECNEWQPHGSSTSPSSTVTTQSMTTAASSQSTTVTEDSTTGSTFSTELPTTIEGENSGSLPTFARIFFWLILFRLIICSKQYS
ncbi:uncharacterized protein LOC129726516 [Wyeomyia smithii]|uniref:uncharacterized protein LOC129726516 n=1 Tax=Wyeomyia smithii TaxID=174621 RepID=UPI0024680959|nr:uncharacterized protein LOC129726516 [Wyeomyia smithii]